MVFSQWMGWTMESTMASLVFGPLVGMAGRLVLAGTVILSSHIGPFPYEGLSGKSDFPPGSGFHQSKSSKSPGWKLPGFS